MVAKGVKRHPLTPFYHINGNNLHYSYRANRLKFQYQIGRFSALITLLLLGYITYTFDNFHLQIHVYKNKIKKKFNLILIEKKKRNISTCKYLGYILYIE